MTHDPASRRPIVLGMVLFVVSEAVFFGLLIITYRYFIGEPAMASAAHTHLSPLRTGIFSLFLFSSSFTIWRAGRLGRAGRVGPRRFWLGATLALGSLFLLGQATEYAGLLAAGVGIGTNLFGSAFFTLTGFHGVHVLIGLAAIAIVLGLDLTRAIGGGGAAAQDSVAIYWHFVDVVWLVIFTMVYLPLLRGTSG